MAAARPKPDVVFLHERLDGGVLDDDQLFSVAGAGNFRPPDKLGNASVNALAASFDEGSDDPSTLTLRRTAADQMPVQLGEDKVGKGVEQPHRELDIARHPNALETCLMT